MANPDSAQYALLEEYRQIYALVLFRLQALDQRIPIFVGVLSLGWTWATSIAHPYHHVLIFMLPLASVWLVRLALTHAQALEDAFRRIEAIEVAVNTIAGAPLMGYQSTHPSRRLAPGGRTSRVTVDAVLVLTGVVSAMVLASGWGAMQNSQTVIGWGLCLWVAACNTWMLMFVRAHNRYIYLPAAT